MKGRRKIKTQTVFHGYRGTTYYWGKQCEEHDQFHASTGDDEYFGHGIYFFENDINEAYNFARYARKIKHSNISVIYAYIETDRLLDFTLGQTYQEYIKFLREISSLYKDEDEGPLFKVPLDCNLINVICDRDNYPLVRGTHNPNHEEGVKLYNKGYTRFSRTHIQLCVKDKSIIRDCKVKYY